MPMHGQKSVCVHANQEAVRKTYEGTKIGILAIDQQNLRQEGVDTIEDSNVHDYQTLIMWVNEV